MLAAQRHLTALAALAVAVLVTAACGSAGRTIASIDTSAEEPIAPTSTAPATSAVTATSDADPSALAGDAEPTLVDPSAPVGAETTSAPTTSARVTADGLDAEQLAQIEEALADADLCGVYTGLAALELDGSSTVRLQAQLSQVRDLMVTAADLAPTAVHDDWVTVTDGTSDMLASLARGESGARAAEHYDEAEYRSASRRVETWMGANCG